MENRKIRANTPFDPDDPGVTTRALREGAITRLGRGSVRDMAFSRAGRYFAGP